MANVKIRNSFWEHNHCLPLSMDLAPASIFEKNKHYFCFDLETKELAPPDNSVEALSKIGVSVLCGWDSKDQKMHTFFEKDMDKAIELLKNRLVIGYNIRRFDLPVMTGYGLKMDKLDVLDIMDEVERGLNRRWIKLEYVAQGTLGEGKSADGKIAVEWYKQGRFEELAEYCARDVEVTTDIFKAGMKNNFIAVQFPDKEPRQFKVDWS